MNQITINLSCAVLVIMSVLIINSPHADEGTSDPDFDFLPPDEVGVIGRFNEFITDMFRSPSLAGSYYTAKKRLYKKIQDEQTFYCGCTTELVARTFDKASCGYVPRNDNERAHRLEAEHILPAFWIANFHSGESCWVADDECGSARECCLKNDERFKTAHNDLVNLIPTVGELNADRSNFVFDYINNEQRAYGDCDFEINRAVKTTEPKSDIRGDIARVYFYMRDTYDLVYPDDIADRLTGWNASDPISDAERDRNQKVEDTQGASNQLLLD